MKQKKSSTYYIVCFVLVAILAFTFIFPLYWIITGSFKVKQEILSSTPVWVPTQWVLTNYQNQLSKRSAPLFQLGALVGPTIPAAFRWLINTVFMSAVSMLLTCLTASMAGYALAKKRFIRRTGFSCCSFWCCSRLQK